MNILVVLLLSSASVSSIAIPQAAPARHVANRLLVRMDSYMDTDHQGHQMTYEEWQAQVNREGNYISPAQSYEGWRRQQYEGNYISPGQSEQPDRYYVDRQLAMPPEWPVNNPTFDIHAPSENLIHAQTPYGNYQPPNSAPAGQMPLLTAQYDVREVAYSQHNYGGRDHSPRSAGEVAARINIDHRAEGRERLRSGQQPAAVQSPTFQPGFEIDAVEQRRILREAQRRARTRGRRVSISSDGGSTQRGSDVGGSASSSRSVTYGPSVAYSQTRDTPDYISENAILENPDGDLRWTTGSNGVFRYEDGDGYYRYEDEYGNPVKADGTPITPVNPAFPDALPDGPYLAEDGNARSHDPPYRRRLLHVDSRRVGLESRGPVSKRSGVIAGIEDSTNDAKNSNSTALQTLQNQYQGYLNAYYAVQANISALVLPVIQKVTNNTNSTLIHDVATAAYIEIVGLPIAVTGPFLNGMTCMNWLKQEYFNGTNGNLAQIVNQNGTNFTTDDIDALYYFAAYETLEAVYNYAFYNGSLAANATGLLDVLWELEERLWINDTTIMPQSFHNSTMTADYWMKELFPQSNITAS